jgi:pyruvate formate lyase activating enzyme
MPPENELPPIVGMNMVAEAGYPDVVCPAVFLPGCNLRCPYCMNASIVDPSGSLPTPIPPQDVLKALQQRGEKRVLVSGGEPCIQPRLYDLVKFFADSGITVRLSTNGTCPEPLGKLLGEGLLEFVAIDIKCDILADLKESQDCFLPDKVWQSIKKIHAAKRDCMLGDYEIRTTLYPPMINEAIITNISRHIPAGAKWVLQQFRRTKRMLSEEAGKVEPYDDKTVQALLALAQARVTRVTLRYP